MADSEPIPASEPAPPPADADSGSLADHEARFHRRSSEIADSIVQNQPDAQRASTEAATPPAETAESESDTDDEAPSTTERERDENGRFVKGSHRAHKHDVQSRIAELTARLRATEEERDALRSRSAPPVAAAPAPAPVQATPPAPTGPPTPDKFSDYSEYVQSLTQYQVEQHWQKLEAQRQQKEQQLAAQREQERLRSSWTARVNAAKTEFPDFEAVALESPTSIPPGSLIDAWILEHPSGARVLYDLQKSPAKLKEILAKPLFEQAEALALLSQRTRNGGASTGAPLATTTNAGPKPPTPVRTSALTAGDEPPDEDRTGLAEHERYYPQRRRHG